MDRDSVDMVLRFVLESPTITVSRGALKHLWIGGEIGRDRERERKRDLTVGRHPPLLGRARSYWDAWPSAAWACEEGERERRRLGRHG